MSAPATRRVMMALPSQTSWSCGCALAHGHWQAPQFPVTTARAASTAARTRGAGLPRGAVARVELVHGLGCRARHLLPPLVQRGRGNLPCRVELLSRVV